MATKCFRIRLTSDPVQPITIPCGAQLLSVNRWADQGVELHFMGDDLASPMTMIIEQVVVRPSDDVTGPKEESIRYIGSAHGLRASQFTTTHLFEVLG